MAAGVKSPSSAPWLSQISSRLRCGVLGRRCKLEKHRGRPKEATRHVGERLLLSSCIQQGSQVMGSRHCWLPGAGLGPLREGRMWKGIGKTCRWKHSKAPPVKTMLRDERATKAVLTFLSGVPWSDAWRRLRPQRRRRRPWRERGQARPRLCLPSVTVHVSFVFPLFSPLFHYFWQI